MATTNQINNLVNMLESLKKLPEMSEIEPLFNFLNSKYSCIVYDSENKIIIAYNYSFYAIRLTEKKLMLEAGISKILGRKITLEFILFDEAVEMKYELALKERDRREEEQKKELEQKEKELRLREQKFKLERIKKRIEDRIPPKFKDAEFKKSLKIIQDYYLKEKYKEKGLFIFGNFGTGKTYNVYALAKQLLTDDIDVRVFNLPRLLNVIRSSFSKQEVYNENTGESSYAFIKNMGDIEKLICVEVLIIDDIGAEKASDWVAETLYYLINSRYEGKKTTIFTSNLSLDKLSDRIGDRIVSRIAEMCDIYEMEGEDRRIQLKN